MRNLLVRAHLWYAGHGPRQAAFVLARLHPGVESLHATEGCWCVETTSGPFYLSDPRQITRVVGLGVRMRERVLRKYTLPEFVEVEPGDTVVDVGAFIGEFAWAAGDVGRQVIAVEPDDRNVVALRRNLSHLPDSHVVQKAAWNKTGERTFQVATDPSEGSILDVDTEEVTDEVTLETTRIDDLVERLALDGVDFLKIEAEGAEPEALDGVGTLEVPKIVVECAPERSGESPTEEVTAWLRDRSYDVRTRDHIVFGRL